MAKIAIILLDQHHEVLSSHITSLHAAGHDVTVFTNSFCRSKLRKNELEAISECFIREEKKSIDHFLSFYKTEIDRSDAQLVPSIDGNYGEYISPKYFNNPYLLVHSYHAIIDPFGHISWKKSWKSNLITLLKAAKGVFTRSYHKRVVTALQYEHILLPSESVLRYCNELEHKSNNKQILGLAPFYTHERMNHVYERKVIKVIVPGTVIYKSRDYQILLDALLKVDKKIELEIVLLGKLKERPKELERLKECKNIILRTYNEYLTQEEYDFELFDADFLILPLMHEMNFGIVSEKTGYTALSGNVNDVTRFAIPALITESIPMPAPIDEISERFADAHSLAKLINQWCIKKTFNELKWARKEESWNRIDAKSQGKLIAKSMGL